ncbi:hypothetical protein BDB00DRAFT_788214 [Zychaea mexicana]|uniref:uncharacterized protein n=1 Tax=Zychaea mexicana TaxID=64656 RepID=UPI0022FE4EEB|nr:uncharacterized protein BDB00DRAFT_788214 [Zychaea mexicana]KAI9493167.1 hypothetical protein BDB00DRAFT_788214 [Zychaea mexicana]
MSNERVKNVNSLKLAGYNADSMPSLPKSFLGHVATILTASDVHLTVSTKSFPAYRSYIYLSSAYTRLPHLHLTLSGSLSENSCVANEFGSFSDDDFVGGLRYEGYLVDYISQIANVVGPQRASLQELHLLVEYDAGRHSVFTIKRATSLLEVKIEIFQLQNFQ